MKRVAIIQARTSSSRLPGKVLEPLQGIPMIVFMLRRVAHAKQLDHFLVATSVEKSDDLLAQAVTHYGFDCYRGDLTDVLSRFAAAASQCTADVVVRLTGDCPLVDPDLIDRSVSILKDGNYDYVSNVDPPTYPNGLDVEVFTRDALMCAHESAQLTADREHVTPYIRRNKALFRQVNFRSYVDLSTLRWTVDHADDLAFVRALVNFVSHNENILPDRFDFLRLFEVHNSMLPKNIHARNERYSDNGVTPQSSCETKNQL
jgi:spore coat polysaccharide biosynthesis protein SpsF (cytidylyltransferase family)